MRARYSNLISTRFPKKQWGLFLFLSRSFVFLFLLLSVFYFLPPDEAKAAACLSAQTGNWSDINSWTDCGGTTPQSADTATIQDTHTITLDTAATVTGVTINLGGTLTEDGNSRTLTIGGTSGWTNNGTFTKNTETLVAGNASMTFTGNTTFNNLTFNQNAASARVYTIAVGTTLTVTGTLTIDNTGGTSLITLLTGTLAAQGNIVADGTNISLSSTTVLNITGAGNQELTVNNSTRTTGFFLTLNIDKPSGDLTFTADKIIRTDSNWTFTGIGGGGQLITTGSTVVFATTNLTITGSHTLNNVIFDRNGAGLRTYTIASGNTLTVAGDLTIENSNDGGSTGTIRLSTGTLAAQGDVTIDGLDVSSFDSITLLINGSGNQEFTVNNSTRSSGDFFILDIDKPSGNLTFTADKIIRTPLDWTFTGIDGGGELITTDSTVVFANANITINGSHNLNNVIFDSASDGDRTYTINDTLTVGGDLDASHEGAGAGALILNTGTLVVQGDLITDDTVATTSTASITLTGSNSQTVTAVNLTGGTFTVNKDAGATTTLAASLVADGTGQDLVITAGILDLAGFDLTVNDTFTNSGTLRLTGDETINKTPTNNSGSTVEYTATSGTRDIKDWTYSNLTINGASGTFTSSANETIGQNLNVAAGTLDISDDTFIVENDLSISGGTLSANNLTVNGDWTHTAGTFTPNSGTVTLNGVNQTISDTNTFYNLTKEVSVADTLTFEADSTQTITNTLTLKGASGELLSLLSDVNDTAWKIDPEGDRDIEFLDVKDSNNINSAIINCVGLNCTNSGGNTNWKFVADPDPDPEPETPSNTPSSSGGFSIQSQMSTLLKLGNYEQALVLLNTFPSLSPNYTRQEIIRQWIASLQKQLLILLYELLSKLQEQQQGLIF